MIAITIVSHMLGRRCRQPVDIVFFLVDIEDEDFLCQCHIFVLVVQSDGVVDATSATTPRIDPVPSPITTCL